MNLYYRIWVDAISKLKSLPKNSDIWKFYSMVFISMTMVLNIVVVLFFIRDIGLTKKVPKLHINIFPGVNIDAFFDFFFSYLLPVLLLNYFLIFYKDRYKDLLKKYDTHDGKLFLKYFLGSIGVLAGYVIIAITIAKMS